MLPGETRSADRRWVSWTAAIMVVLGVVRRFQVMPGLYNPRERLAEAFNVARAFARDGTIADAFRAGQGPTAHLMPLPAIIAGTVYRHFGLLTARSDLILTSWATLLVFATFILLFLAFKDLGSPPAARLLALAALCFLPLNLNLEVIWFRVWDGAMATFLGALVLYAAVRLDRAAHISRAAVAAFALLAAVTFFVAPPVGLGAYCCALILLVRRLPARRWAGACATAAVLLGVVLTPWTIRNERVMGAPVVLRDNFGLELGQANDPSLVGSRDADGGFERRHLAIHPYRSPLAYARMVAAGGEIAYSRQLGDRAERWIAAHPLDFMALSLRHLRQMLFPDIWMWPSYPGIDVRQIERRAVMHWTISALGIAGIVWSLRFLPFRYRYAAIMTMLPILPYLIVQPTLRYRYVIFGLLTFFAADFVVRLVTIVGRRKGRHARPAAVVVT